MSSIHPTFQTIYINYVPSLQTRELDLQNAAASGKAMTIDVPSSNVFDVAQRGPWLQNSTFVSTIHGVSILGPYTNFFTDIDTFDTNVTNAYSGYYHFQPFSDIRMRLAFADSVNLTAVNIAYNNGLGEVAPNSVPPGLPPQGCVQYFSPTDLQL